MGRFRYWTVCALLPLLMGAQSPPKQISVISSAGPGSIPISEIGGVEMIPVRGVVSFVGATVRPASERGAVTVSGNGKMARVSDGRNFVPVEGRLVLLQSPARLVGDEWFVPLDFVTKVLPTLSAEAITYRESERMLVLGSSFPEIRVRSRHDPHFTRVAIESDRAVSMTHTVDDDAIRVRIATPFLNTDFRGEDIRDDVVERITLDREQSSYVLTIYLGESFGELKTEDPSRRADNALVLDLVRSRIPTRTTNRDVEDVPWDLRELATDEDEPTEEAETGDDAANPNAEVINLNDGTHYLPEMPQSLPTQPSVPGQIQVVTLDPGHGGSETGAEGHNGAVEKDVVLSIARRFRTVLQERLGVRVILTRDEDRELSLDERAAIANSNKSNLFLSIHADASPRQNARGSSVYFLSHTSTPTNPSPSSGGDLDFILWDMAQTSHLSQSSQLAEILQEELQAITGGERVNRGIKQNSFRVLKGATMPAVLIEVGFISNSDEEKLLSTAEYQDKLAEALYRGIVRYKDRFEYPMTSDRAGRSAR